MAFKVQTKIAECAEILRILFDDISHHMFWEILVYREHLWSEKHVKCQKEGGRFLKKDPCQNQEIPDLSIKVEEGTS